MWRRFTRWYFRREGTYPMIVMRVLVTAMGVAFAVAAFQQGDDGWGWAFVGGAVVALATAAVALVYRLHHQPKSWTEKWLG